MLTALHIENIAIINRLDVELSSGFTVFTGETGAGKSIFIDAIQLLLGNKASRELIRAGTDAAIVNAIFCDLSQEALDILAQNGLSPDDDGNITVYRKITPDGRNIAKINGIGVTVATLKELGMLLVNIHGQHDGVLLLDSRRHLSYLDAYGALQEELTAYRAVYREVKDLRDRLHTLREKEAGKEQRRKELAEWLAVLNECSLRAGEYEELMQRRSRLMNDTEITSALESATAAIYDGEQPAGQQVREALDALQEIESVFPQSAEYIQRLTQVSAELDDIGAELGKLFDRFASEQMDPAQIEERLDQLEAVKKQFGPTDSDVLNNQAAYQQEWDALDSGEEAIRAAEVAFSDAHMRLEQCAATLTARRVKAARQMEKELQESLAYLDMPGVRFEVQIRDRVNERGGIRYRADGKDDVEFFLSPNRGEPLKPMAKIASGGELSRIMLSIKSVLNQDFDTVIYDEIDTGVSGATAEKIGKKLRGSVGRRQVFCVTHLAQIAALADHHFRIFKNAEEDRVISSMVLLDHEARVREIARIMGGEDVSEALLHSAKELLEKSQN